MRNEKPKARGTTIRGAVAGAAISAAISAAVCAALFMLPARAGAQEPVGDAPPARPIEQAGPVIAGDATDFSLTVYSTADPAQFDPRGHAGGRMGYVQPLPGYGVVRETRRVDLTPGRNTIRLTGVASGIDPTTVSFKSLTAPEQTSVVEQSYEYDLLGTDKLLEKFIDRPISVVRRDETGRTVFTGTLLSFDGATLILRTEDPQTPVAVITRGPEIESIQLASSGSGLITRPTLVWDVATNRRGPQDIQISYQTDGMTWRADYNLIVNTDDTRADVGAWVTLVNRSGASYPQATLKLVAGDVQRVQATQGASGMMRQRAMADAMLSEPAGFSEKSFFEYHLYTLGRPTSVPDNSTKQIELFPQKTGVPVEKVMVYYGNPETLWYAPSGGYADRDLGTASNNKVDVYLRLANTQANGMGVPLPAGRVRVLKRDDADGSLEFVGEDVIQHTPREEKILIKLGSAFDVVGERKQTDFQIDNSRRQARESFEIKIRNRKREPVKVIVKETMFRWAQWTIDRSTTPPEKQDARTVHFPLDIAPDEEKTLTYTVEYSW